MASIRGVDLNKTRKLRGRLKRRKQTPKFFNDYTNSSDFGG